MIWETDIIQHESTNLRSTRQEGDPETCKRMETSLGEKKKKDGGKGGTTFKIKEVQNQGTVKETLRKDQGRVSDVILGKLTRKT